MTKLRQPDGAFYTSQDADVDEAMPGKSFYALSAEERDKLGREPRIDTNIYARENGWAISGLVRLCNATGDADRSTRRRAAPLGRSWRTARIEGGGFRHGDAMIAAVPISATLLPWGRPLSISTRRRATALWLESADRAGSLHRRSLQG